MKQSAGFKLRATLTVAMLVAVLCWRAGMNETAQRLFSMSEEDLDQWLKITCFTALALMWTPHRPRSARLKAVKKAEDQ